MQAIKLYNFPRSGHAHRVELMLSLLKLPTDLIFVDLAKGEHKQPAFLALNAFGQVPVIDDQGVVLADSNAILVYLAQKYGNGRWLPADPVGAAKVQRWLSVAAGELEIILADFELPPLPIHVVYQGGRKAPARVRSFVDFAVKTLREHPALKR